MKLDHISYVSAHNQISETVSRIGSQIKTAFVDGGFHPKFGTRNFIAPLLNGTYIEVVCPIDHPATDTTPFGRMVKQKAELGGGWLTWVIATKDIQDVEDELGRKSTVGIRKKPNGTELEWKQIGVLETLENQHSPFFIEWQKGIHPSRDGIPIASISRIEVVGKENQFLRKINKKIDYHGAKLIWDNPNLSIKDNGISRIQFKVENSLVEII